jgi:hypothetical protein
MNFATENNLVPSDDGSTEEEQSVKDVKNCARHSNRKYHDNLSDTYLFQLFLIGLLGRCCAFEFGLSQATHAYRGCFAVLSAPASR